MHTAPQAPAGCFACCSDVLAQTGDGCGDISQEIASTLLAAVRHQFLDYALDLAHAETSTHQSTANAHDAAHVSERTSAGRCTGSDQSFVARQAREQCLHFVSRTFF